MKNGVHSHHVDTLCFDCVVSFGDSVPTSRHMANHRRFVECYDLRQFRDLSGTFFVPAIYFSFASASFLSPPPPLPPPPPLATSTPFLATSTPSSPHLPLLHPSFAPPPFPPTPFSLSPRHLSPSPPLTPSFATSTPSFATPTLPPSPTPPPLPRHLHLPLLLYPRLFHLPPPLLPTPPPSTPLYPRLFHLPFSSIHTSIHTHASSTYPPPSTPLHLPLLYPRLLHHSSSLLSPSPPLTPLPPVRHLSVQDGTISFIVDASLQIYTVEANELWRAIPQNFLMEKS